MYNMIENNYFDLNKTFDANQKVKGEHSNYGNYMMDRAGMKKDMKIKQKPAAPEITKKPMNLIGNINSCFSDSSVIQYSNVSSTKSFNRPKSMERMKRKPTKTKSAKSKPRK